jgi:hypothetical protein
MVTFFSLFFLSQHHKIKLWSHRSYFWQDFFGFSIFGHFFCPFLKIPKYFAQKYLEKRINWKKDLKTRARHIYYKKQLKDGLVAIYIIKNNLKTAWSPYIL